MERMIDKTGMFGDFNFKLAVINELLDKNPVFESELEKLKDIHCPAYEWYSDTSGPIPELMEYFSQLPLADEDLSKIEAMCFDGGNDIYLIIQPDWDGEDGIFDFTDISGFERLKNLKSVTYISMCDEENLIPMKNKGIIIE